MITKKQTIIHLFQLTSCFVLESFMLLSSRFKIQFIYPFTFKLANILIIYKYNYQCMVRWPLGATRVRVEATHTYISHAQYTADFQSYLLWFQITFLWSLFPALFRRLSPDPIYLITTLEQDNGIGQPINMATLLLHVHTCCTYHSLQEYPILDQMVYAALPGMMYGEGSMAL